MKHIHFAPNRPRLSPILNRFIMMMTMMMMALASSAFAQQVTVDVTPGHATNTFSPLRALGIGIDRDPLNSVNTLFGPTNVPQILRAGWGPISYRLNTELSIQAWHWNPTGAWSDPGGRGYFVGSPTAGPIHRSFGYNLPHRGTTSNYGTSGGYSVVDDGDLSTYWKSNPYLDEVYTHESNALHPAWILIDLGSSKEVNAIQIAWANPYAVHYEVQYWTGNDPIGNPGVGQWKNFPDGEVTDPRGGYITVRLSQSKLNVEYVRVLMTDSSNTCDTHGSADRRNCLGFAMSEVYLGYLNSEGAFVDLMSHSADGSQTLTYASSIDPWHAPRNIAKDDGEQPGFDLVYHSGVTRGLPMTIPVAMLYDNPENAANEIAYLESRGFPIRYVEMGEEPDGQFVTPEDYAALYVQWADAIREVDPKIELAGPVFEGVNSDVQIWRDAQGNISWFNRFLNYLRSHRHLRDLNVMTFEHYPFDPCHVTWDNLYQEPQLVKGILKTWRDDGLPARVPMEITESNLAYDTAVQYMQPYGALWLADYAGSFLSNGGRALYYYQAEPLPMYQGCGGWGTFGMFNVDSNYQIKQVTSQFFAAQLLTQEWAQPVDEEHKIFPAATDIKDAQGNVLVTSYSTLRPDGQWALLLVNKDQSNPHSVRVNFSDAQAKTQRHFAENVTEISFGAENYKWHAMGAAGYASPDGPSVISIEAGGKGVEYTLPRASVTVLRGNLE